MVREAEAGPRVPWQPPASQGRGAFLTCRCPIPPVRAGGGGAGREDGRRGTSTRSHQLPVCGRTAPCSSPGLICEPGRASGCSRCGQTCLRATAETQRARPFSSQLCESLSQEVPSHSMRMGTGVGSVGGPSAQALRPQTPSETRGAKARWKRPRPLRSLRKVHEAVAGPTAKASHTPPSNKPASVSLSLQAGSSLQAMQR